MILLKLLMKFKSNKGIDKLFNWKNGAYFEKLSNFEVKEFLDWYLSQEYTSDTNMEKVYDYLRRAALVINSDALDIMAESSIFFETIPDFVALKSLKGCYGVDEELLNKLVLLKTLLTSKVSDDGLITLLNMNSFVDEDYVYRRLVESDIKSLVNYGTQLERRENKSRLAEAMVFKGDYAVSDLQKYWENSGMSICDIIIAIGQSFGGASLQDKEELINILENYMRENIDEEETIVAKVIVLNLSEELQINLLKKLFLDKEYDLIFTLFNFGIDTSYNFDLIRNLIDLKEELAVRTLVMVNEKYLGYTFMQIANKGQKYATKVMELMVDNLSQFELWRVDKVLDMLYQVYFDLRFIRKVPWLWF